jgi:predicted RNA polymerase sigma factor
LRVRLDGRREGRDRIYLFAQIQRVLEINELRIAALYDALAQVAPSPVVELNRAVAVSMAFGPAAGLELVDALTDEPSLEGYHLLPSVRGDLLTRLGRFDEARRELERAASLTRNERERTLLLERARGVAEPVELRTDLA